MGPYVGGVVIPPLTLFFHRSVESPEFSILNRADTSTTHGCQVSPLEDEGHMSRLMRASYMPACAFCQAEKFPHRGRWGWQERGSRPKLRQTIYLSAMSRRALLSFDAGKDVIDIVVGSQGDLVQRACLNALDDFVAGEVEDRLQNLRALLLVRLPHDEEHAGAVLDVAGRKQLPLQDLHDDGSFGAVKAAWIAGAVQLGEELRCPFVVVLPQLIEQLPGEACSGLDLEGV